MNINRPSKLQLLQLSVFISVSGLVLSTVLGAIATADLGEAEVACACTPAFGSQHLLMYVAIIAIAVALSQVLRHIQPAE